MSKTLITTGLFLWALGCGGSEATEAPPAAAEIAETGGAEAPANTVSATQPTGGAEISQEILASFDAFNRGDLDGALAPTSFEVEYTVIGGDTLKGKGHLRKLWETLRTGFPDMQRHVRRIIHTGETVAVEYVVTGTHKGEFEGNAATKKTIGYDALMIFHSAGNQVTRITVYEDEPSLRRQIGAADGEVPPRSPPPMGKPEIIEGDGDRSLVNFVKGWYKAAGPNWNSECEKTYCTEDVAFYSMPDGASMVKQMDRSRYLDLLVEGSKDFEITDLWMEPAGKYFVTFTTWKRLRPSVSLGLEPSKKLIDLKVAQVILLQDGKLKEVSTYFNRRQALSQLGE